jgi:DNA polymerase-3 subunit delta
MAAKSIFRPFIVLFGEDDFFLDRDVESVLKKDRIVIKVDAEDGLKDTVLVDMCEGFQEPHTVVVENAQKVKGEEALRQFISERDASDKSVVVIAVVRSAKLPDVWAEAAKRGKKVERRKYKPWEDGKYLDFIRGEATRLKVSLGKDVASLLYQYVGSDLYRLSNELKKLSLYVGQDCSIQKKHVAEVVSPTPDATPYAVAEAVMAKDLKKAMRLFSYLYAGEGDTCLVPVVSSLMRQVEKTASIRALQDRGVEPEEIAVLTGTKLWPYKNLLAPVARKHSFKSLAGYMGRLCQIDVDVKGSSRSKRTLVETTMLTIAQ